LIVIVNVMSHISMPTGTEEISSERLKIHHPVVAKSETVPNWNRGVKGPGACRVMTLTHIKGLAQRHIHHHDNSVTL